MALQRGAAPESSGAEGQSSVTGARAAGWLPALRLFQHMDEAAFNFLLPIEGLGLPPDWAEFRRLAADSGEAERHH